MGEGSTRLFRTALLVLAYLLFFFFVLSESLLGLLKKKNLVRTRSSEVTVCRIYKYQMKYLTFVRNAGAGYRIHEIEKNGAMYLSSAITYLVRILLTVPIGVLCEQKSRVTFDSLK